MIKLVSIICFVFLPFGCVLPGSAQSSLKPRASDAVIQSDKRIVVLTNSAKELLIAFEKRDFEKFADMISPIVPQTIGGRKNLISAMKNLAEQNTTIFRYLEYTMEEPGPLVANQENLFAVVPFRLKGITFKNHEVITNSCFVGISNDDGVIWKFASCQRFNTLFPAVASKLSLPKETTAIDGTEQ